MSANKYIYNANSANKASIIESRLTRSLSSARPKLNSIKRHSLSRSSDDLSKKPAVKISHIIGDFGGYQIAVVFFAALRAMCCSMDGLSSPFLSPDVKTNRYCLDCDRRLSQSKCIIEINNGTLYELEPDRGCYFYALDPSLAEKRIPCSEWSFDLPQNKDLMTTLTVEQSLVCDREWLKSFSNSVYFIGATLGLLFWGFISDKYGRKTAYVYSHFITLIFGFSSLFATNMKTYILLRAINSFGMIGELIPRSIQVEIVAADYRFVCSVICQTGWAFGIILVPVLSYINPSYKFILSCPVIISALMLPWLYWLPESARWLIINNKYKRARDELIRAAKINGKLNDETESQIEQFSNQVLREEHNSGVAQKRLGVWRSLLAIFTNSNLLRNTLSVFVLLFVAEVVYFSLTLNVADQGGSQHLNYIISGFSELISITMCGLLLAYLSRRMCLSTLLLTSTLSYLLMSVVNIYEGSISLTVVLIVNAFGKITAIANLMVIILVTQEVFPTVIRQFGTSLCITIGKTGSAVAPFTHELGQIIGHGYCFGMFSIICFVCSFIPLGLSETGSCELPDTVDDVENNNGDGKRKALCDKETSFYDSTLSVSKKIFDEDLNNNFIDINNNDNNNDSSMKDLNLKTDVAFKGSGQQTTDHLQNVDTKNYHDEHQTST